MLGSGTSSNVVNQMYMTIDDKLLEYGRKHAGDGSVVNIAEHIVINVQASAPHILTRESPSHN